MVFALPWAFRRRAFGWRSVRPEKRIPQSGIVAAQIEQNRWARGHWRGDL
jgi:hypothetical protein